MFSDLPKVMKTATAQTVDIVARKVNKNLKNHVALKYNVPKSSMRLGKLISIKRANVRANIGRASIFIKRVGRGLIKYDPIRGPTVVSVLIKKSRKRIKGAFISSWEKGGIQQQQFVFAKGRDKHAGKITRRTKKGAPYIADKREVLYGPPIADLYTNASAGGVIMDTIDKDFQPTLDVQFNKQFEKKGRR
jgi:hypothetical protein